jgi:hypothetical protein
MGTPGEPSARNARAFLTRSQNPDGGWGYRPGSPSATEPTGAALVALGPDPEAAPAAERARRWLEAAQRPDGGWGLSREDPESHWMTAWGILGLARLDPHAPEVARGVRWLIELPVIRIEAAELTAEVRRTLRIDPRLRGWPWRPGEASWVEPTALALLALDAASVVETHRDRIAEAVSYLVDRRCVGGGWNFGNPFMLGANLPPRPHPTAWALLALRIISPQAIRPEDVTALRAEMDRDGGAMALALGQLALTAMGIEDPEARERLQRQQAPDGSWESSPYVTALSALALNGGWPWAPRG